MKFSLTFHAESRDELLESITTFLKANATPIIDGRAEAATVVGEEKPKTTKPKANGKAKAEAPKAETPKTEEKIECRDKPLTEPEVRSAMIDYVNAATEAGTPGTRKEIFKDLLSHFGVEKLADLPAEKYVEMLEHVKAEKAKL
jgi:hypothetical protein